MDARVYHVWMVSGPLERFFRLHFRKPVAVPEGVIESVLNRMIDEGKEAWPAVVLSAEAFVRALAEREDWARRGFSTEKLSALHAADMYLSCACLYSVPGAHEAMESHYLRGLPHVLVRADLPLSLAEEACLQLRERLFAAESGALPKIATYDGRGSLKSWLRVAALRTALSMKRRPDARTVALNDAVLCALPPQSSPEIGFMKVYYQADVKAVLQELLLSLPTERSHVLRLHLLDELTLEEIGKIYRVNRSTVKRWLDDIRAHLLKDVRSRLRSRLGIADEELEQFIALMQSQLDLSLSRILKAPTFG